MTSITDYIFAHFLHVAPLLLTGMIFVAITVERVRALFFLYPMENRNKFFDRLRELVLSDRLADGIALCDLYPEKPIAQVAKEGLLRAHQPEEMIGDGLQLAVSEAAQRIIKRTGFLAMIANVATLMGLFGTIAGLIQSFGAVGHADAQQKSQVLAEGISTAMNATMMGLGIAIPAMIAFSFLMNRSNRLTAEIEQAGVRTMDLLRSRYISMDAKNESPRPHRSA